MRKSKTRRALEGRDPEKRFEDFRYIVEVQRTSGDAWVYLTEKTSTSDALNVMIKETGQFYDARVIILDPGEEYRESEQNR